MIDDKTFIQQIDEFRKRRDIKDGCSELEAEYNHLMRLLARKYEQEYGSVPEAILQHMRGETK